MAMRNAAGQRATKPWGEGGFVRLSQVSGTRVPRTKIELRNTKYRYQPQPNPRSTAYPSTFTTISMTDGLPFNFLQPLTWFRHTNVAKLIYCLRANVYTTLSRVRRNRDQRRQKAKNIQDKPPLYNSISPRPRAREFWISFP